MPPKISRSRMRHISHCALFAALNLTHPVLYSVQEAAQAHRWKEAYEAWSRYFAARDTPPHLLEPPGDQQALAALHNAERVVRHEIQGGIASPTPSAPAWTLTLTGGGVGNTACTTGAGVRPSG
jgi:hypothetical protein